MDLMSMSGAVSWLCVHMICSIKTHTKKRMCVVIVVVVVLEDVERTILGCNVSDPDEHDIDKRPDS